MAATKATKKRPQQAVTKRKFKAKVKLFIAELLTTEEREHILTMVNFFDDDFGEADDQRLKNSVLDSLRRKMNRREPMLSRTFLALEAGAREQAQHCGEPDSAPASLYALATQVRYGTEQSFLLWDCGKVQAFATLDEAQVFADEQFRRSLKKKGGRGGPQGIDEWEGDQLVRTYARDAFDAWGSEDMR